MASDRYGVGLRWDGWPPTDDTGMLAVSVSAIMANLVHCHRNIPDSDIDVFVEAVADDRFGFPEFMKAYEAIQNAVGKDVGYDARTGLSPYIRDRVEHEAIRVFLMTDAERAPTRLLHIRDEIDGLETAIAGGLR